MILGALGDSEAATPAPLGQWRALGENDSYRLLAFSMPVAQRAQGGPRLARVAVAICDPLKWAVRTGRAQRVSGMGCNASPI